MADTEASAPNSVPNRPANKQYWDAVQKNLEEQEKRMVFPGRKNPVGNPQPLKLEMPQTTSKEKKKPAQ
jgi:hypothetical protein